MENMKYRVVYEYEFYCGSSASEATRSMNDEYGATVAKENMLHFWFQRFRSENFAVHKKPFGRPETKVEN